MKIKYLIMNRKTYDDFFKHMMLFEEDVISQAIALLEDKNTYKAGTHKKSFSIFINNTMNYEEIMAVHNNNLESSEIIHKEDL